MGVGFDLTGHSPIFQDCRDDLPVFDEADYPHGYPTLRTGQTIGLLDLLDHSGPVFPVFL
jgi:hypothetical protein